MSRMTFIHAQKCFSIVLLFFCEESTDGKFILGQEYKGGTDNDVKVAFIVLSQSNSYHVKRAEAFQEHFNLEVKNLKQKTELYLLHEKWPSLLGGWSIFPLIDKIVSDLKDSTWIVICEDETRVNVKKLLTHLSNYDPHEAIYLGKGLQDKSLVIIHHFQLPQKKYGFTYPDFAAGMAITMTLVKKMAKQLKDENGPIHRDFSIDAKHEFAWFIFDGGKGSVMKNVSFFCTNNLHDDCATSYVTSLPQCGDAIGEDDLFIAVKTCEKHHKERLPIIKELWADSVKNIEMYSETADLEIPTVDIGVPNTERGHCGKLQAILQRAHDTDYIKNRNWLVIADDDTLLSVPRLEKLLACYDHKEAVALGERYGYGLYNGHGYDYITGGGSMVLSMEAVRQIINCEHCRCYKNDQPDDMMLGLWLKRLNIPVTHSALFHQARVADYSKDYLARQLPVSFHKFWENNPKNDFLEYLTDEKVHDEL